MARRDDGEQAREGMRASRRCVSISAVSSPAWVEAAAMIGALADRRLAASRRLLGIGRRLRHVELEIAGGARCAARRDRDSARHRRPTARGRDRSGAAAPRSCRAACRQRLNERSDSRPLTRISGMPRSALVRIRFGQRSDSANSARSGCQWSRKRRTKRGASSGTNWWMTPGGSRCSASLAEVTVPDVTQHVELLRARCARSAG